MHYERLIWNLFAEREISSSFSFAFEILFMKNSENELDLQKIDMKFM